MVGIIANRTYNYYTQGTDSPCTSVYEPDEDIYQQSTSYNYSDLNSSMKIPNMGAFKTYQINWYNALTGNPIVATIALSGVSGKVELDYPQQLTGDATQPMLFFEVFHVGYTLKSAILTDDSLNNATNKIIQPNLNTLTINNDNSFKILSISPNPTKNVVNVIINFGAEKEITYYLVNVNGKILEQKISNSPNFVIDLSVYENGMYYLVLESDNKKEFTKIIKQ